MAPTPIYNLLEGRGYPLLTGNDIDGFLSAHERVVLFFAGNPQQYPESADVAVILPELMKQFGEWFTAAVIASEDERELQTRFGVNYLPALVFLRRGEYLGAVSKVQDWGDYVQTFTRMSQAEPTRAPSVGIPVVGESAGHCH